MTITMLEKQIVAMKKGEMMMIVWFFCQERKQAITRILYNVGGSDVAPAYCNVRDKHTVTSRQTVVSLMILLKL